METTIERLSDLFIADYLAGTLHWRAATSNVRAGDRAGCLHSNGYRRVQVDGKLLYEHRIIVSMIEGRMLDPDEQVDHENGVRGDNRIENLRIVDGSENNRNRQCHRDGQPVGIYWNTARQKWQAQMRIDGRKHQILRHPDQSVVARAFEIVDRLVKDGVSFDEAKAAARRECLA